MATALCKSFVQGTSFMEADCLINSPQVHVHHLVSEEESLEVGYCRVELCCHGCGHSLLVTFVPSRTAERECKRARDSFERSHRFCPDRGYDRSCPIYRNKFEVLDLRPKRRVQVQRKRATKDDC